MYTQTQQVRVVEQRLKGEVPDPGPLHWWQRLAIRLSPCPHTRAGSPRTLFGYPLHHWHHSKQIDLDYRVELCPNFRYEVWGREECCRCERWYYRFKYHDS